MILPGGPVPAKARGGPQIPDNLLRWNSREISEDSGDEKEDG